MSLYDIHLASGRNVEVDQEQAKAIAELIEKGATTVSVNGAWIRTSGIMSILPSFRDHEQFRMYQRFINDTGKRMDFESYLDAIDYPRERNDRLLFKFHNDMVDGLE